jgi:6-phosphogluconolactonase
MKTFLAIPTEAAPGFSQRKPVLQQDLLAGELRGRTPCAAPLGHANQSWPRRIGDRKVGIRRPWFKIWSALAIALIATPSHAQFLYVTNVADATVSGYKIKPGSGELTPIAGSPFAAGGSLRGVAVDPSGRFAYVAQNSEDDVLGFGRFAYVLNQPFPHDEPSNVSGYTINPTTGALTAIAGSPFEISQTSSYWGTSLAVDPNGEFAYVTVVLLGIFGDRIDPGTGELHYFFREQDAEPSSRSVTVVDPSGKFAYVTNLARGHSPVSCYEIEPGTGRLVPPGSVFAAGDAPNSVVVDPSGKFVYVTNEFSDNVSGYTINPATGELTPIAGSPFPAGSDPRGMAVDPGGRFAYVANFDSDTISGYKINPSTGARTAVAGSPFAAGGAPISVAIARRP